MQLSEKQIKILKGAGISAAGLILAFAITFIPTLQLNQQVAMLLVSICGIALNVVKVLWPEQTTSVKIKVKRRL